MSELIAAKRLTILRAKCLYRILVCLLQRGCRPVISPVCALLNRIEGVGDGLTTTGGSCSVGLTAKSRLVFEQGCFYKPAWVRNCVHVLKFLLHL